ncbi:MAG: hypothetical protein RBT34_14475 [Anaerolineaceae bacterium]|jgi:hypothetical protein|nr:hypothetical protein [Anaerolineaceae bacterium]
MRDQTNGGKTQTETLQKILLYAAIFLYIGYVVLDNNLMLKVQYPSIEAVVYGIFFILLGIYWVVMITTKEFYGRRGMYFDGKTALWVGVIGLLITLGFAVKFYWDYFAFVAGS